MRVTKKLLELWLDPKYRYKAFSLSQYKDVIDGRINELEPPSFIKRMPRSVSQHLAHLKAGELKTWLFFYSVPIVESLMQPEYFCHYLQLVLGLFYLNQSSITPEEIKLSKELLAAFVSKFQVLYDPKFMSYNLHCLLHLPEVVQDLMGPYG